MNPALMEIAMAKQQQQQNQPQQNISPIDSGAMAGMEATKRSLEMDEVQRKRALGRAMSSFFTNLSKPGYGPGFSGALSAMNASFEPGLRTYQDEEERAMRLNAAALQRQDTLRREQEQASHLQQRQQEEALYRQQREQEMQRRYNESMAFKRRQLEEMTPYQKAHIDILKGKSEAKKSNIKDFVDTATGSLDVSEYPIIETVNQKNMYAKDFKSWSEVSRDLESINKDVEELKEISQGNLFSPLGSVAGEAPNIAKDYLARLGTAISPSSPSVKRLNKESIVRNRLVSKISQIEPLLERSSKGGAPDAQLLKRFHELKVYLGSNQPINVVEDKLRELLRKSHENKETAHLSLKSGRQIDFLPTEETAKESPDEQSLIGNVRSQYPEFKKFTDEQVLEWALRNKGNK
jgi:hypothetical protein